MSDMRIQYNEEMVGAGHPTKQDTLNRLALAEADIDGHGLTRYLRTLEADPATSADECALYAKTVGGHVELFHRAESGGAVAQLTSAGELKLPFLAPISVSVAIDSIYPAYFANLGSANPSPPAVAFADAADTRLAGMAVVPSSGYDYQVCFRYEMSAAQSGKAVVMLLGLIAVADGEQPHDYGSYDVQTTQIISTRGDAGIDTVRHASFVLPKTHLTEANQMLRLALSRQGANAADTHTGVMYLHDLWLEAK